MTNDNGHSVRDEVLRLQHEFRLANEGREATTIKLPNDSAIELVSQEVIYRDMEPADLEGEKISGMIIRLCEDDNISLTA